ncbi:MAG: purine-nucleoside phosphorylase [Myxococcota bacterium]|nr:purine-nucleoside phosphorylase [Myxococcota bacterium]MDW8363729.1 purine-nucleoside phosphorylase [Myxococcales bacterium]
MSVESPYDRVRRSLDSVRAQLPQAPSPAIGFVLGSGLGAFADAIEQPAAIAYEHIEGMPASTVPGHAGRLVLGLVGPVPVAVMQGRVHLYEGREASEVVHGVRLLVMLGARTIVLTNAAGGLLPGMQPGELMLIEDHMNLTGRNPLVGPNDERWGPRFPDMTDVYDPRLRALAVRAGQRVGVPLRSGVYAGLLGPSYETPAEVRMLARLGASAVGMSTVLEAIAARHMGARLLGISCITNLAAGLAGAPLSHDEVADVAGRVRERFIALLRAFVDEYRDAGQAAS